MTDILKKSIQETLDIVFYRTNRIKEIFESYFGEDRVELSISDYFSEDGNFIKDFIYFLGREANVNLENETSSTETLLQNFINSSENSKEEIIRDFTSAHTMGYGIQKSNSITVYFPEVTITNENGNFTVIKNLFARLHIYLDGTPYLSFKLLRSHYTYAHFRNNYMHSHVSSIPMFNPSEFQDCCTGTGPINDTMRNLRHAFDEAQWMQFCWDLDKYVRVESLSGVPYHKLVDADCEVATGYLLERENDVASGLLLGSKILEADFFKYIILSNKINFSWVNNNWKLASSFSEFTCIITKLFLQWVKETHNYLGEDSTSIENLINGLMMPAIYKSTGLYRTSSCRNNSDLNLFVGKEIIKFKGVQFLGEVDDPINQEVKLKVLKPGIIKFIAKTLLKTLNENYGRKPIKVLSSEQ